MSKFRSVFHRKTESLPSTGTPEKLGAMEADSLQRTRSNILPSASNEIHPLRTQRSTYLKDYITTFKSKRFLSLRFGRVQLPQNIVTVPSTSLFTPRSASGHSGRHGSSKRRTRHNRRYSVNLADISVLQDGASESKPLVAGRDTDTADEDGLNSSTDSPFNDRHQGSPLDTVRLARRRSKASRHSAGHPSSLAPPRLSATSPLKSSYPDTQVSECDRSCLSLWSPPAYRSRSRSRATEDGSPIPEARPARSPSHSRTDADFNKTALHRAAEILQHATKRLLADPAFSQRSIFGFLAPIVTFFSLLTLGITIPRYYPLDLSDGPSILALIFAGVILSLIVLRTCIWVVHVLAMSFCEADLAEVLRKRGMVDANGMRMAEGDMVAALF